MVETIQTLVVGAGAVGLATARGLARAGHEVLVIDKAADIGTETSSRNSEVIHAGIYYPPGSLKARLCVEGRHMLYEFCREHGVEVRRTGKLIVAVNEAESPKLKALAAVAVTNRVDDLVWMTASDVARIEPEVSCKAALLSPSTGIIDSRGFMLALHGDAEAHGASVILRTGFVASQPGGGRINVTLRGQTGEEMLLACRNIVNSAGHGPRAPVLSRSPGGP